MSNPPSGESLPANTSAPARRGIVRAASIISIGNVSSRLLGLVRETVIAHLFGATGLVSAFRVAAIVPTMVFDMLIGGMLSSALVPVFSEYSTKEDRTELWRLVSAMLSLATIALGAFLLLITIFAPQVAWLLGGGFDPGLLAITARMIRILAPSIVFFGCSGVITGLLYTLHRFRYPAFGAAVYNLGIILAAIVFHDKFGIESLAFGILIGSFLQLLILLPDLRDVPLYLNLALAHPGLRRILRLYVPIAFGLIVSEIGVIIDRNLASHTGPQSIAWMQYATTLVHFPLGLVSAAISLAVLPSLSQLAAANNLAGFKSTLATGLRFVIVLIIPATVGLFVLAHVVVGLIFQHGDFGALDTIQTARALRVYLLGLTFAAVDQPLIFAFYARQDTWTPAIVGVISVLTYLGIAIGLVGRWGMMALVFANSIQLTTHALIMLALLRRHVGRLEGHGLTKLLFQTVFASAVMGGAIWAVSHGNYALGNMPAGRLMVVALPGLVGFAIYGALLAIMRVNEVHAGWRWARQWAASNAPWLRP
ncbi:MAG: murein biosynthesis integral membrane protein MurJ [Chloroflexi bacterium]|nr:murein biosynthesis integral membrane protein MurJ [Chloroflexota bacterium]